MTNPDDVSDSSQNRTGTSSPSSTVASPPPAAQRPGYAHSFKYVVVGDSGCGKTALVRRFCSDSFEDARTYTVGVDFLVKTVSFPNGHVVKLQVWDTAGQERYRSLIPACFRGARGVIIVYDVTDRKSYDSVMTWMREATSAGSEGVKVIVVGNKTDLCDGTSDRHNEKSVRELCSDVDSVHAALHGVYHVSAKTGEGVSGAFQQLTDALMVADTVLQQRQQQKKSNSGGRDAAKTRWHSGRGSDGSISLHENYDWVQQAGKPKAGGCCTVM